MSPLVIWSVETLACPMLSDADRYNWIGVAQDTRNTVDVMNLLLRINQERKMTCVMVSPLFGRFKLNCVPSSCTVYVYR